jgi:CRP/FNR family transcriptional regulator, cyclic AMP receptor protein
VLFRHLESRIGKALLQLSEESGTSGGGRQLHLSQSQLGHIVGASRESINKILQAMQRAGLIDLAKGSIIIRDRSAIEQLI